MESIIQKKWIRKCSDVGENSWELKRGHDQYKNSHGNKRKKELFRQADTYRLLYQHYIHVALLSLWGQGPEKAMHISDLFPPTVVVTMANCSLCPKRAIGFSATAVRWQLKWDFFATNGGPITFYIFLLA